MIVVEAIDGGTGLALGSTTSAVGFSVDSIDSVYRRREGFFSPR